MWEKQREEEEKDRFGVWPENWPILAVFLRCVTQWTHVGMSAVVTGLNYASVDVVLRRSKIPLDKQDWAFYAIQEMEVAAVKIINKKQEATLKEKAKANKH